MMDLAFSHDGVACNVSPATTLQVLVCSPELVNRRDIFSISLILTENSSIALFSLV